MTKSLSKLTAFSTSPNGGNPAGVWTGDQFPADTEMQRIAKDVGYSETIFICQKGQSEFVVRYFSPEIEVPFCGHATIAGAIELSRIKGPGAFLFQTNIGSVPVTVTYDSTLNKYTAALVSRPPEYRAVSEEVLAEALAALNWSPQELSTNIPPALAYAGNWHLVIAVKSKARLDELNYNFEQLKQLMILNDLGTLQLCWQEEQTIFHSRNPFPIGGVIEDPATGSAAAALGGYLREAGLIKAPFTLLIKQGIAMGRPSLIEVITPEHGGIVVRGTATWIE